MLSETQKNYEIGSGVFCVDLRFNNIPIQSSNIEACEYDKETLKKEMKEFDVGHPALLQDDYRRIFFSLKSAEDFVVAYRKAVHQLAQQTTKATKGLPCIMAYTSSLALVLMGLKTKTNRNHRNKIPVGSLFNFTDRKNFVTLKLLEVTKTKEGEFCYQFTRTKN